MTGKKTSGYADPGTLGCQFSVYPLRQEHIGPPIEAAIRAAAEAGCGVRVGNLSTLLTGTEDQVFSALRAAFRAAQAEGPSVLVATLAAGIPEDALVAEIQTRVKAGAKGQGGEEK